MKKILNIFIITLLIVGCSKENKDSKDSKIANSTKNEATFKEKKLGEENNPGYFPEECKIENQELHDIFLSKEKDFMNKYYKKYIERDVNSNKKSEKNFDDINYIKQMQRNSTYDFETDDNDDNFKYNYFGKIVLIKYNDEYIDEKGFSYNKDISKKFDKTNNLIAEMDLGNGWLDKNGNNINKYKYFLYK